MLVVGLMCASATAFADAAKKVPSDAQLIKMLEKAAPPEVTKGASYMTVGADMKMRPLKDGNNGWMCMAVTAGPEPELMCMDKTWQAWGAAYSSKTDPPVPTTVGVAYMLAGDHGTSNTEPYAEGPTADNHWVVTGPHIMLLMPDPKALDAYPTDPMTGGPYVMWKGTKYQHVMVPVASMPKQPAPPKAPAPKK
jgi:hypothetical protein